MDEKRKVQLSQEKINFETQRIRLINLELMQCFDAGQNKMYNVMLQNETSAMSDELGRKRKLVDGLNSRRKQLQESIECSSKLLGLQQKKDALISKNEKLDHAVDALEIEMKTD
mmetsp:Transcript_50797/g.61143  ORF Transcript_50797/g.61143 Transcript_50797/m.61143 type:complete len:114 (+) Transcript_50797:432-773(+)